MDDRSIVAVTDCYSPEEVVQLSNCLPVKVSFTPWESRAHRPGEGDPSLDCHSPMDCAPAKLAGACLRPSLRRVDENDTVSKRESVFKTAAITRF